MEKVIEEEVMKEVKVFLMGDMNARMGVEDVGAEDETLIERGSQDKKNINKGKF